jgi:hypothetical protein
MTRRCWGIRRMPLASLCWLVGPALLAGCAWERGEPPRGSIKDPIARASTGAAKDMTASPPAKQLQPQPRAQAPQPQQPRTCHDVPSCEALLRELIEGADRSWIARSETPEGLLTGVRMFAFRTLRPRLTCGELAVAMRQLRSVPEALRPAPAGSSPEDVVRATRLAAEVHDELRAESDARCRSASPPPDRPARPPASVPPAAPAPAQPQPPPAASTPPAAPAPGQPQPPPAASAPPAAPAPGQPPTSPTPGQPDAQPTPAQPERRPEQQ